MRKSINELYVKAGNLWITVAVFFLNRMIVQIPGSLRIDKGWMNEDNPDIYFLLINSSGLVELKNKLY